MSGISGIFYIIFNVFFAIWCLIQNKKTKELEKKLQILQNKEKESKMENEKIWEKTRELKKELQTLKNKEEENNVSLTKSMVELVNKKNKVWKNKFNHLENVFIENNKNNKTENVIIFDKLEMFIKKIHNKLYEKNDEMFSMQKKIRTLEEKTNTLGELHCGVASNKININFIDTALCYLSANLSDLNYFPIIFPYDKLRNTMISDKSYFSIKEHFSEEYGIDKEQLNLTKYPISLSNTEQCMQCPIYQEIHINKNNKKISPTDILLYDYFCTQPCENYGSKIKISDAHYNMETNMNELVQIEKNETNTIFTSYKQEMFIKL